MDDLAFAVRTLRKNPVFSMVAVVTLALGIGANTAIFSVVRTVLLNKLPYKEPGHLVAVAESDPDTPRPETVDFTTTHDWRSRSKSFEHLSIYRGWRNALNERGEPELINGFRVNHDFFDMLGIQMQLGRTFRAEEDRPDTWHVLILSHGLWMRRFGGDPRILGRSVWLNEAAFTVVGVLPPDFQPVKISNADDPGEMFAPLGYALSQSFACRGCQHLHLLGRLKPGVSPREANAELNTIMRDIVREHPNSYHRDAKVSVVPLRDQIVGRVSTALWVLLGAVGLVLLLACANVANLLLARAAGRGRELAIRAALGASRRRLVRQLLTESLLLAAIGGLAGMLLARFGTLLLASLAPPEIPRVDEIVVDTPVLLFGLLTSLLTGLLFGLAPALRASRVDLNEVLKEGGKSTGGRSNHGLRNLLVTAELAIAFLLVVAAGLLGKSFLRLMNADAGYDPHNVLTLNTYVYGQRYQKPDVELGYYDQVVQRVRATAGIESVAMVSTLPLRGFDRRGFHIHDRPLTNDSEAPSVDAYSVSPDYFRVMRIPVKRGRALTDQDDKRAPPVALISESCAQRVFPGADPIGRRIQLGGRDEKKPWITIVGIVGNIRQYGLERSSNMEAYIAQAQDPSFGYTMVARTLRDPSMMERGVREAFLAVDKTLPVFNIRPMEFYLKASLAERTFTLALLGLFGALALILAAVGIYGVISYSASLRTREIGIRIALGATRRDVMGMVLRQGVGLIGLGLGSGLVGSLAFTQFLSTLLYEVQPRDPATTVAVAGVLAFVALGASYLPARRATRVDPITTLRNE